MQGLEYVCTYLDHLLVMSNGMYEDHIKNIDTVFTRLQNSGLRIHAEKSNFCRSEVEYIGYVITRDAIKHQLKIIEAILNLKVLHTVRYVLK